MPKQPRQQNLFFAGKSLAFSNVVIDGQNTRIIDLIQEENGLQRLWEIPNAYNTALLIENGDDLNVFFRFLYEPNRLAGLEWLHSLKTLFSKGNADEFSMLSGYSASIAHYASLLSLLNEENRQYFVARLLEPPAKRKIKASLQEDLDTIRYGKVETSSTLKEGIKTLIKLGYSDFSGLIFHENRSNFTVSYLKDISFSNINFKSSIFHEPIVECRFINCNLERVSLQKVEGGLFQNVGLGRDTHFQQAQFINVIFQGPIYLSSTFLDETQFIGVTFNAFTPDFTILGAAILDFSFASLNEARFTSYTLNSTMFHTTFNLPISFQGADLTKAIFSEVQFKGSVNFQFADFSKAIFSRASFQSQQLFPNNPGLKFCNSFQNAIFHEANFNEAIFDGHVNFAKAEFYKADFSGARFLRNPWREIALALDSAAYYNNFKYAELKEANFSNTLFESPVDFESADFNKAIFSAAAFMNKKPFFKNNGIIKVCHFFGNARFFRTKFNNTIFQGPVSFIRAKFSNTDLSEIQFNSILFVNDPYAGKYDADFYQAELLNIDFNKSVFQGSMSFEEAILGKVDFSGAHFRSKKPADSLLFDYSNNFYQARLVEVNFKQVFFHDSVNFSKVYLCQANFDEAEFKRDINFQDAKLENVSFKKVKIEGAVNFQGADLQDVDFSDCDLSNADFGEAVGLGTTILKGATLTSEQLFQFYKQGHRNFLEVKLVDELPHNFKQQQLSGAKFSEQLFKHLTLQGFRNFQASDLRAVSPEVLQFYRQQTDYHFEGAQWPVELFCPMLQKRSSCTDEVMPLAKRWHTISDLRMCYQRRDNESIAEAMRS